MRETMRTNGFAAGAALVAVGLLAGCGGGGSDSTPKVARSVSETMTNGLTFTLGEDRTTVPVGGAVTYNFTLSNPTDKAITFTAEDHVLPPNETDTALYIFLGNYEAKAYPVVEGTLSHISTKTLAAGQSISATFRADDAYSGHKVFSTAGTYNAYAQAPGADGRTAALVVTAQ